MAKRKYELKARAEQQERTRRRIIEAAVELHERLGPAHTSLSAVAERAGVQRLTLYRHFPDELSLLQACGGHYRSLHPPPDPARWRQAPPGRRRLTTALRQLYEHFRETERMWANVLRDAATDTVVFRASEPRRRYRAEARAALAEGWTAASGKRLAAALNLAVDFPTWSTLKAAGLEEPELIELVADLVDAARR